MSTQTQPNNAAPPCAGPDFSPRQPSLGLPDGACDCHAHVIGPSTRYSLSADRVYTPVDCLPEDYQHMRSRTGLQRAVLVQPSIYGTDNRLLLDTLARHPHALRGVAVASTEVTSDELLSWHQVGVRGLRINLVDRHDAGGALPMGLLQSLAARVAPLGWHLELLAHVDAYPDELMDLQNLPVPIVFGHFGYPSVGRGVDDRGFQALLRLISMGRTWVKLTGPYRLTRDALPYPSCDAFVQALVTAAPERLVWGSDWPHVMLRGVMPNDADLVDLIARWLPTPAQRQQILVENPTVLYDFDV